jgi:hypothetical protein
LSDCLSPTGESRTLYLLPGQDVAERLTVEAVVVVRQCLPAVEPDGTRFAGFTEFRLMDALRP